MQTVKYKQMKLLFFCILFIIIICNIRLSRKTPAWGNYIDGAIQSCNTNQNILNVNFWKHTGLLREAEKKFKIQIHLPPLQHIVTNITYDYNNHLFFPHFLKSPIIKKYIRELQLKRTLHIRRNWSNYIIIHLRLGDITLFPEKYYKLYPFEWYKKAISLAKHFTKNCKVLMISNLTHKSNNLKKNRIILDYYAENLNCDYMCDNSEEEDIHCFMNCAVLINTISSFSFYAGLVSKNLWITTTEYGSPTKLVNLRKNIIYLPSTNSPLQNNI